MSNAIRTALASLLIASFAPLATAGPAIQYHPRAGKPFSSAVRVGDFVYISGVVGTAADGTMPTDFVTQATNAMNAVAKQLQLAGASMDDVYRCTIALTNMDNWDAFNAVYLKYFKPDHYPVRMSFGVTACVAPRSKFSATLISVNEAPPLLPLAQRRGANAV